MGKLKNKRVLITGGDSGIVRCALPSASWRLSRSSGWAALSCALPLRQLTLQGRSVALLMAREGAQITIQHLPSEDKDARDVKAQIEKVRCLAPRVADSIQEGSKCCASILARERAHEPSDRRGRPAQARRVQAARR